MPKKHPAPPQRWLFPAVTWLEQVNFTERYVWRDYVIVATFRDEVFIVFMACSAAYLVILFLFYLVSI